MIGGARRRATGGADAADRIGQGGARGVQPGDVKEALRAARDGIGSGSAISSSAGSRARPPSSALRPRSRSIRRQPEHPLVEIGARASEVGDREADRAIRSEGSIGSMRSKGSVAGDETSQTRLERPGGLGDQPRLVADLLRRRRREQAEACVNAAFDAGINFIDTANVYGRGAAESLLGEASRAASASYVLATKVFFPMSDTRPGPLAAQIHKQIDASLERLRTDYVDLYQCHRYDSETPLEETMAALTEVVRAGKARYIGFSEWPAEQIEAARDARASSAWSRASRNTR